MKNDRPLKKKRRRKSHNFLKALVLLASTALLITLTAYVGRLTAEVGQAEPTEQAITVSGEATVGSVPDLAIVTISLESKNPETATAQNEHSAKSAILIDSIKKLNIRDEDIQTTNYSIYEDQKWDSETKEYTSIGWIVNESWEIRIKDLNLVDQVLLMAGQNGATNVNGPRFQVDDTEAALEEARVAAIADAKKSAAKIADALGLKLDNVIDYTESTSGGNQPFYAYAETMSTAPKIEPGEEQLSMYVTITFRLR